LTIGIQNVTIIANSIDTYLTIINNSGYVKKRGYYMGKKFFIHAIFAIAFIFSSCGSDETILSSELGDLNQFRNNEVYSIIMIPDTQRYFRAKNGDEIFAQEINWIVKNSPLLDVRLITHIGDVIEDGKGDINHPEWSRSVKIMQKLHDFSKESGIPYSVSLGDHDYNGDEKPYLGYSAFVKNYGKKRYDGFKWYGGSSNTETSHYQYITLNGRKILHLNIECDAPRNTAFKDEEDQLKWAQKIIDKNPGIPVILSTHAYLTDENEGDKFVGREPEPEVKKKNRRKGEDRRGGVGIWNELVKNNDQIFMVLCGNYHEYNKRKGDTGEFHQVSKNSKGRDVIEILGNYQGYPNGGDGLFRILVFNEKDNTLTVKTYSSYHKKFRKKYLDTPRASDYKININMKERLKV